MLKKESQNLWEDKMSSIFRDKPSEEVEMFLNLISVTLYGRENDDLSKLYHYLGLDSFSKVISLFSGRTITFPSRQEFRDNILIALTFYLKEFKGQDWNQIKEELPFEEVNSIKYGKGINKLKKSIQEVLYDYWEDIEEVENVSNRQS